MPPEDFVWQPTLRGRRLLLRPVNADDWDGLYAAASDPAIWAQHPAADRYLEPVFRQYFDEAMASGGAFCIVDIETDEIIGSSRYHGLDVNRHEVEIGWTFLRRDYWGGSYNRELKTLMLDHAFRFVDTVVFWVGEQNHRSRRAVEKLGASLRTDRASRGQSTGKHWHVVYALPRERWQTAGTGNLSGASPLANR